MCFADCSKLNTVEFKSTVAPTLEGTVSKTGIEYDPEVDTEIYELLNKYFQFNGYYPLYYGQFRNMIGMNGKLAKLNIVLPKNEDLKGYDNILYNLFFDLSKVETSTHEAMNKYSIDYLNKVVLVPTDVKLSDELIIQDARTAYNLLNQDLTKYGYEQAYLDSLLTNLEKAEAAWKELKMERIEKVYEYLIEDIKDLGPSYSFDKIADYYSIVEVLDRMDKNDKGEYLIDGTVDPRSKRPRYGTAELYVDRPGLESQRRVTRRKLIVEASNYIMNDERGYEGRLLVAKVLGRDMKNQPNADVEDFLLSIAEKTPEKIISAYTGGDLQLRMLFIEAREKGVIYKKDGLYLYGEDGKITLGATDSAVIEWMKSSKNQKTLSLIRKDTYPEMFED